PEVITKLRPRVLARPHARPTAPTTPAAIDARASIGANTHARVAIVTRARELLVGLALAAASVTLTLAGIETYLRLTRADRYELSEEARAARASSIWTRSDDPILVYKHRPNYRRDGVPFTEDHGVLRRTTVDEAKRDGVFRIVVLGDSIAAGLELPYERR